MCFLLVLTNVGRLRLTEKDPLQEYMHKIDLWGRRSGIVKVIPPKEWCVALFSFFDYREAD